MKPNIDYDILIERLVHRARELTDGMLARVKRPPDYADFRAAFDDELMKLLIEEGLITK